MMSSKNGRRPFLKGLFALIASLTWLRGSEAGAQTPPATEGPFYPTQSMRFADVDNDLVKILSAVQDAGGDVITLRGTIKDQAGHPLEGHRIEIWQCDLNGKYLHSGDDRNVEYDTGFQGFGHDITDKDGRYSFRTIKPGKYPGRAPHIHVKVFDGTGRELLTTQFYEAGNAENKRDRLYRRLSSEQADRVTMAYADVSGRTETTVDVIV